MGFLRSFPSQHGLGYLNYTQVDSLKPLFLGAEIFSSMKKIISEAKEEVLIVGYKINQDSDAERDLIEALKLLSKRALADDRRVKVKFIINRKSKLAVFFKSPNAENSFQKKQLQFPNLDLEYLEHTPWTFGSLHSKFILVDGYQSMINSNDLAAVNNYQKNHHGHFDCSTLFEGSALGNLLRLKFENLYHTITKTKLEPLLVRQTESQTKIPLLLVEKPPHDAITPIRYASPFSKVSVAAIEKAKRKVLICAANLNNAATLKAIIDAALRGVEIKLIFSKYMNEKDENKPFQGGSNRKTLKKFFKALEEAGFEHYENIAIRWSTNAEARVVENKADYTMHAKLIIADDIVIAGSSNLDAQSEYHSDETNYALESEAIAKEYERKIFEPCFEYGMDVFEDFENEKIELHLTKLKKDILKVMDEGIQQFEKMLAKNPSEDIKKIMPSILGNESQAFSLKCIRKTFIDQTEGLKIKNCKPKNLLQYLYQYKAVCQKGLQASTEPETQKGFCRTLTQIYHFIINLIFPNDKVKLSRKLQHSLFSLEKIQKKALKRKPYQKEIKAKEEEKENLLATGNKAKAR